MKHLNLHFAYAWEAGQPDDDPKYRFLRGIAEVAATTVMKMRGPERGSIGVNYSRLRARHGALLLDEIRRRIQAADVLLFDLEHRNPNVMFELGLALANPASGPTVFILMPGEDSPPSDLAGYLFSKYHVTEDYHLVDPSGFHAALRSALIDRARRKGVDLSWREGVESGDDSGEVGEDLQKPT
jgi:hypothetical protein